MADDRRSQQVSLGCGTLILIALIVLIFGGRGHGDLEREVHGLRDGVAGLRRAVDAQTDQIRLLHEKADKLPAAAGPGKGG
jgi:hypothetical protein